MLFPTASLLLLHASVCLASLISADYCPVITSACTSENGEFVGLDDGATTSRNMMALSAFRKSKKVPVLKYKGGRVLTGDLTAHLVFYGTNWGKSMTHSTVVRTVKRFLNNISKTDWYSTTRLYYEKNKHGKRTKVHGHVSVGQVVTVPTSKFGTNYRFSLAYDVLSYAFQHKSLPVNEKAVYFVFTDSTFDRDTQMMCGYHYYGKMVGKKEVRQGPSTSKKKIVFATIFDGTHTTCHYPHAKSPVLDAKLSYVAHELTEMITDPFMNGWRTSDRQENADLCTFSFSNMHGKHNVEFKDHGKTYRYQIQDNWDYRTKKCRNH